MSAPFAWTRHSATRTAQRSGRCCFGLLLGIRARPFPWRSSPSHAPVVLPVLSSTVPRGKLESGRSSDLVPSWLVLSRGTPGSGASRLRLWPALSHHLPPFRFLAPPRLGRAFAPSRPTSPGACPARGCPSPRATVQAPPRSGRGVEARRARRRHPLWGLAAADSEGGASRSARRVRPGCVPVGRARCVAVRPRADRGPLAVAGLRRYALWCGRPSEVGLTGFEPATSPTRTERATRLRHSPKGPKGSRCHTRAAWAPAAFEASPRSRSLASS